MAVDNQLEIQGIPPEIINYIAGSFYQKHPQKCHYKKIYPYITYSFKIIEIATVGENGPHLVATWGEFVTALGVQNGKTILIGKRDASRGFFELVITNFLMGFIRTVLKEAFAIIPK